MTQLLDGLTRRGAAAILLLAASVAGCQTAGLRPDSPPAATAPDAAAFVPTPPEYAARIAEVARLGRTIYMLDQWAWHATDAVIAQGADPVAEGFEGWVTGPADGPSLVRFVRRRADVIEAAYDVRTDARTGLPIVSEPADRRLTAEEQAQFAARALAIGTLTGTCTSSTNAVVFRDPETRDWRVYLMAATKDPDLLILGGDQRVIVSVDGRRVLSSERLSRSCLNAPREQGGGPAVALMMTEIVSDIPNETQVFDSLQYGLPLTVVARSGAWMVSGDTIRKVAIDPPGTAE